METNRTPIGDLRTVKSLLSYIPEIYIDSWSLGGGLLLDYIDCMDKVPNLLSMAKSSNLHKSLEIQHNPLELEAIRASAAASMKEIVSLWVPLLKSMLEQLVKLRAKGLESTCFAGKSLYVQKGRDAWQAKVCISEMSSKVLSLVRECEAACDTTIEVSG
jgi:hypothetical protein